MIRPGLTNYECDGALELGRNRGGPLLSLREGNECQGQANNKCMGISKGETGTESAVCLLTLNETNVSNQCLLVKAGERGVGKIPS